MAIFKSIKGKIFRDNAPLQYYTFTVVGINDEFVTDKGGNFFIEKIPSKTKELKLLIGTKEVVISVVSKEADDEMVDIGKVQLSGADLKTNK